MTNYEELRANIAMNALNALLSSSITVLLLEYVLKKPLAELSVKYADQLIKALGLFKQINKDK